MAKVFQFLCKLVVLFCFLVAKVMGSLAVEKPKEGHRISGVLIKRGFNYHLVNPEDLASKLNTLITPFHLKHYM